MYIRLFVMMLMALMRRKKDSKPDLSVLSFRVMPWDCVLRYMGNDRYHSFMDLGRIDLTIRLGWAKTIFKEKWNPQVVSCYVRHELPLAVFDHFFLHTYIVYSTNICVWMAHQFVKDGVIYSTALSKIVAVSNCRVVRLKQLSNYGNGIRRWPFQKSTVNLFDNINIILKELHALIF